MLREFIAALHRAVSRKGPSRLQRSEGGRKDRPGTGGAPRGGRPRVERGGPFTALTEETAGVDVRRLTARLVDRDRGKPLTGVRVRALDAAAPDGRQSLGVDVSNAKGLVSFVYRVPRRHELDVPAGRDEAAEF